MGQLYRMKQTREWLVKFDYERAIKLHGKPAMRRSFLVRREHIAMRGTSLLIHLNDVGRVFVLDEYEDGDTIDYILDRKLHPEQWAQYGGFKPIMN